MDPAAVAAARAKLAAKMGGNSAKIGGKGTQRRPPAKQHKSLAVVDDKKLQVVLKKLSVNAVSGLRVHWRSAAWGALGPLGWPAAAGRHPTLGARARARAVARRMPPWPSPPLHSLTPLSCQLSDHLC